MFSLSTLDSWDAHASPLVYFLETCWEIPNRLCLKMEPYGVNLSEENEVRIHLTEYRMWVFLSSKVRNL
jgi:hypothetical protein